MLKVRPFKHLNEEETVAQQPAAQGTAPAAPANQQAAPAQPAAQQQAAAPNQAAAPAPAQNQQQQQQPAPAQNNEQQPAQNQPAQLDLNVVVANITTFLANLLGNIKQSCTGDAMVQAIPALKDIMANTQLPYNPQAKALSDAVSKLAGIQVSAENSESVKNGLQAFSEVMTKISELTTTIQQASQNQQQ